MKKLTTLLILANLFILTYSQPARKIDEIFGFRDYKFETSTSEIPDLKEFDQDNTIKFYKKENENLTYGTAELHEIVYGFYNDKLMFINIRATGKEHGENILKKLNEEYDKGHQKNSYIEKYTWFGKTAGMVYEYSEITHTAEVSMYSKKLYGETRQK